MNRTLKQELRTSQIQHTPLTDSHKYYVTKTMLPRPFISLVTRLLSSHTQGYVEHTFSFSLARAWGRSVSSAAYEWSWSLVQKSRLRGTKRWSATVIGARFSYLRSLAPRSVCRSHRLSSSHADRSGDTPSAQASWPAGQVVRTTIWHSRVHFLSGSSQTVWSVLIA